MASGRHVVSAMDEQVANWVAARVPHLRLGGTPYTAIGQIDGLGNLVGGVVFENFTERDIHLHVAGSGKRWLTRRFLGECFRYVFQNLGCRRCTVAIAASNAASIRFCAGLEVIEDDGLCLRDIGGGLGFRYEGVLRAMLPDDEDLYIFGMLREECRWLSVGRKQSRRRAA